MIPARTTTHRRRGRLPGLLGALGALVLALTLAGPAPAGAIASGYWYGADGAGPGPVGASAPYTYPSCGAGHAYGAYIGKIGGADLITGANPTGYGPGHTGAWNAAYAAAANADHFQYHQGIGTGGYWWLQGPLSPQRTGAESDYQWGRRQGLLAISAWFRWWNNGSSQAHRMPLRILWGDVEQPTANKWSRTDHVANRQVFNGYFDIIQQSSRVLGLSPGVYSTRTTWNTIMGDPTLASQGYIPNTWEWTAQHSRAAQPAPCPASFASSPHPLFFGGQTEASAHALMWQWSIGNADYDLIDSNRPGIPITR